MTRVLFFHFRIFALLALFSMCISLKGSEIEKKDLSTWSISDKYILENFFHNLFADSCAGYVFYGSKPLYLNNPPNEKKFCIGSKSHKEAIETREALSIWNDEHLGKNQTNYFLQISDPSTNLNTVENEFLLINRQVFLECVNKNLILFKYKLGINITAEAILKKLLDKKINISTLFKGNTALLGIVLGYGSENSISYERFSSIIKPIFAQSSLPPPYKSGLVLCDKNDFFNKCKSSNVPPSFGYDSLSDEVDDVSSSLCVPTDDYEGTSTKIAFTYHKDSEESKKLLEMYKKAQIQVEKINSSENFLDEILSKFNTKFENSEKNAYSFDDDRIAKILPKLVAQSVWDHVSELNLGSENNNYLDHFIAGMKDAEKRDFVSKDALDAYRDVLFFDWYQVQLSLYPKIKQNLAAANMFFKTISEQPGIVCVESLKIYHNILKKGAGDPVSKQTNKVSMHYTIKDIEGKNLSGSYRLESAPTFEVAKLIPGLIYGLQGMRKNEIRDIFIHQNFAYGVNSDFGEGKALCIQVELIDMEFGAAETQLPELVPVDLLCLQDTSACTKNQLEELQKKYLSFCGLRTWLHYKKAAKIFTLDDILVGICAIQHQAQSLQPLDKFNRKILRRFDLFLYAQPPYLPI